MSKQVEDKKNAELKAKEASKATQKKPSMFTDPRRYYQGSEYQNKVEEINTQISNSQDREEKAKLQKELQDIGKEEEAVVAK